MEMIKYLMEILFVGTEMSIINAYTGGERFISANVRQFRKVCFSQTLLKLYVMQVRQVVRWLGFIYFLKLFRRGFFFLLITFLNILRVY